MISGINAFREWFRGMEEQYVIIGGTACDLLMEEYSGSMSGKLDMNTGIKAQAKYSFIGL